MKTWRRGGEHWQHPVSRVCTDWGPNPIVVLAIRLMSRKGTAAARRHHSRYEYLFVRADGEQFGESRGYWKGVPSHQQLPDSWQRALEPFAHHASPKLEHGPLRTTTKLLNLLG